MDAKCNVVARAAGQHRALSLLFPLMPHPHRLMAEAGEEVQPPTGSWREGRPVVEAAGAQALEAAGPGFPNRSHGTTTQKESNSMSVSIERRLVGGLVAILAAFALFAATSVDKAGATEVLPSAPSANTPADVDLQTGEKSWFIPNNAYFNSVGGVEISLGCDVSSATFQIPPNAAGTWSLNRNQLNIGTYSTGPGGVIADINDGEPDFADCDIYVNRVLPQSIPVTVDTDGEWTVSLHNVTGNNPIAAIAIPAHEEGVNGVKISINLGPAGVCELSVVDGKPQSAIGEIVNGDQSNDAELNVDTQLKFQAFPNPGSPAAACIALGFDLSSAGGDGEAIAQFEAKYNVTSSAPFQVLP